MAIFKRGGIYHTDFSVHGHRFRLSLGTGDWREAQARQKEKIAQAEGGKLNVGSHGFARLGFTEAAERHLEDRKPSLATRSIQTEKERLKPLVKYFQRTPLNRISTDMLRRYIVDRKSAGAANKTINLEIAVIRGVLKRAKLWHLCEGEIKPLRVEHQVGRALTDLEKAWMQKMAARSPNWQNACIAMTIALNTTMRSCELKGLRWGDVDFFERTITVRKSKTDAGRRLIPLNAEAWTAIMELYERAKQGGTVEPEHFLFAACENGNVDPLEPVRSWRTAWRNLTQAIECPRCEQIQPPAKMCRNEACNADIHELKSPTAHLRFHDLRHHAITALAESQASDQTIMAIAGHVSREMLDHYSHVRLEAKRRAVEALSQDTGRKGYVTKYVTDSPDMTTVTAPNGRKEWSGREDLNLRPPGPEPGALPG